MAYDTINLEKGMYNGGSRGFNKALERLDPSENYRGTPLGELDAFERQLKRFDIKVSGKDSDRVEKFFNTSNSSVLFPEYVSRAVFQGMESANSLPNIIATVTEIDSMDYRSVASIPSEDEKSTKVVMEGASLPETEIKAQENLLKLRKRGRLLVASYETLKFQKLDLFTVTLKQIGAYITKTLTDDAVDILLNGDGNNNAIKSVSGGAQTLNYAALLKLWAELEPYNLNTMLANTSMMQSILALTEMKDAVAGLNFQGTGTMITPLGANLIHVPSVPNNVIIGLDKNYALEMVTSGGVVTEFDKLIDRQLERASISCIAGFAKIFNDACLKLTTT